VVYISNYVRINFSIILLLATTSAVTNANIRVGTYSFPIFSGVRCRRKILAMSSFPLLIDIERSRVTLEIIFLFYNTDVTVLKATFGLTYVKKKKKFNGLLGLPCQYCGIIRR
jgi:hypothetical protein